MPVSKKRAKKKPVTKHAKNLAKDRGARRVDELVMLYDEINEWAKIQEVEKTGDL